MKPIKLLRVTEDIPVKIDRRQKNTWCKDGIIKKGTILHVIEWNSVFRTEVLALGHSGYGNARPLSEVEKHCEEITMDQLTWEQQAQAIHAHLRWDATDVIVALLRAGVLYETIFAALEAEEERAALEEEKREAKR